ncbi:DMT family transporter [Luteimonas sp. R10]|uniref:DMT family transporter n=1 Tax=Luteimonas sp. R10 TaxID=3108176 RepID=UPI00308823E7|nr:DMT family transporter [Luteimonas sp. R10]
MNATAQRFALTLAAGGLIGSGFVVAKLLLDAGANPAAIALVQVGGAGLFLGIALKFGGGTLPFRRDTWRYLLVAALIGIAAGPLLGQWVLARIPAGVFTVAVTLSPMFTTLINAGLDRRLPAPTTALGIGIGLAGVLLVLVPRAQTVGPEQGLALALALGVPVLLAAGNVYRSRRWPDRLPAPAAAAGTLLAQGLLLPLFFARPAAGSAELLPLWPLLAALVTITIAGSLAASTLQRVAGAAAFSQIGYVIALTGVAASALVFGDALGALFWPALALVFAGIAIGNRPAAAALAMAGHPVPAR